MPRQPAPTAETKPLTAYTVIINGTDHTILATDEADLQRKIEQLK